MIFGRLPLIFGDRPLIFGGCPLIYGRLTLIFCYVDPLLALFLGNVHRIKRRVIIYWKAWDCTAIRWKTHAPDIHTILASIYTHTEALLMDPMYIFCLLYTVYLPQSIIIIGGFMLRGANFLIAGRFRGLTRLGNTSLRSRNPGGVFCGK